MKIVLRPLMLVAALMLLMSCFAANANAETDLDPDHGDSGDAAAERTGRFIRLPFFRKKFEKINRSGPGDTDGSEKCSIADACQCDSESGCSVKQLTEFCRVCDASLEIDDRFKGPVVFKELREVRQASIVVEGNTLATKVSFPELVKTFDVVAGDAEGFDCPASLSSLDFPKLKSVGNWFLVGDENGGCTGLKAVNAPKLAFFGPSGNNDCNTDIGDGASPNTGCALCIINNPNLKYAKLKASAILRGGRRHVQGRCPIRQQRRRKTHRRLDE